ncbi:hypothetical protein [Dyadobacter sp.]|uniref:hypothetical protein n=1 Tax=Dyadobacter sp. TaxID=1914288 RepID=UPI003F71FDBF
MTTYNTDYSTAKVTVTKIAQVPISKTSLGNYCPSDKVSLNLVLQGGIPENSGLFWYTTPNHTNESLVADPSNVPAGTYFAFFYDYNNSCFNTDLSTAKVTVVVDECNNCKAGTNQVPLTGTTLKNNCSQVSVNLNDMLLNSPPPGSILVWFNTENHSGLAIKNQANVTQSGKYYAFFYDSENNCFNTNLSTAHVTVTIEPCETACHGNLPQVQLTGSKLGIVCPATKGDLNSKFTSTPPQGFSLVWFATDIPIGNPLAHPNAVGPGTYYAFFYDSKGNCFNVDKSTSLVTVASVGPCQTLEPESFLARCDNRNR